MKESETLCSTFFLYLMGDIGFLLVGLSQLSAMCYGNVNKEITSRLSGIVPPTTKSRK